MALDLIPRSFWNMSSRIPSLLDEDNLQSFLPSSGLSISEDDNHVYVEAAVPGIDPSKIEVTYDKGVLWIRGEQERAEEDDKKKFYRKALSSFSYRVAVPGEVDENSEPDAVCKNGVMKVTFNKLPEVKPKRLNVRTE